jgi:hypothetical protein
MTADTEAIDRPFVVVKLDESPRATFMLPLRHGRDLLTRITQVEADPPALLASRIQTAADNKVPFTPEPADEPVMLEALTREPPLVEGVLTKLRDALREKANRDEPRD